MLFGSHASRLRLFAIATLSVVALVVVATVSASASFNPARASASVASVSSPTISAPPDVVVGEASGSVSLRIRLNAPGTSTVTVAYATANGTALSSTGCVQNADTYVGVRGTLKFVPGKTSKVVRVMLNNCHVAGFGSFTFNLSTTPMNATTARDSTNIGIVGDGNVIASPGLYVRNAVVDSDAGTVAIPVLLGGPSGTASNSTVTVNYATSNGTATAGTDYTMTSGTLTFGPGPTAANVAVAIAKRSTSVPSRSFTLTLASPVNAGIVNGTGTVVIGAAAPPRSAHPASPPRLTWWSGRQTAMSICR